MSKIAQVSGRISRRQLLAVTAALSVASATGSSGWAQAKKPIKIGMPTILAMSLGKDARDGLELVVNELNASGGILGRPVTAVVADETFSPEGAKNAITRLLSNDEVDF